MLFEKPGIVQEILRVTVFVGKIFHCLLLGLMYPSLVELAGQLATRRKSLLAVGLGQKSGKGEFSVDSTVTQLEWGSTCLFYQCLPYYAS